MSGESNTVLPYQLIEVRIKVHVEEGAQSGERNEVSVSGGGAPAASISHPVTISEALTPFGIENYELTPEEEGGKGDTQAGSHPFQLTFTTFLNQAFPSEAGFVSGGAVGAVSAGMTKDLRNRFPVGLIGNPKPFEQCTEKEFLAKVNKCPPGSVVGVAITTINEPAHLGLTTVAEPLFNLEPPAMPRSSVSW